MLLWWRVFAIFFSRRVWVLEKSLENLLDHLHNHCYGPRLDQQDCLDHQVAHSHEIMMDLDHSWRLQSPYQETPNLKGRRLWTRWIDGVIFRLRVCTLSLVQILWVFSRWRLPLSRALSLSFGQKVSLNGAEESDTHSSYGLGRNFVTYITNTTLPHIGAIIFIKPHITSLYSKSGGLAIDPIGMWV
jgi:hypothetical protein